jgi:hypothetical protein
METKSKLEAIMKINGYEHEGTGGGCTALIARKGDNEILLTDGDMSAPETFPCEYSIYTDGEYDKGGICANESEAIALIKKI